MNNWPTLTIENVVSRLIDYRGKTPKKTSAGVKLITAKVIKGGTILDGNHEYIADEDYDSWMRRGLPQQQDILITTEAPLGEVAQLRTSERIALAQRVILLRGNPNVIDQAFFYQALKAPFMQAGLQARATGTTVAGIKQSELRQVEVPLPPLPTQRKIAAVLSAYDDLIENNARRVRVLEDMARALYREWFVEYRFPGHEQAEFVEDEQGRRPKEWEWVPIPYAIEIDPRTKVDKDIVNPFVPMGSLAENSMVIDPIEKRQGNSGAKFKNGDTLFARITPCLENGKTGYVNFLPNETATAFGSTEYIVMRSRLVCPEYVYLLARLPEFRSHAEKSMSGASGRQRVKSESLSNYYIAVPDGPTLSTFRALVKPMFASVFTLSLRNANLRRTRDLLLPRLVSGELDVSGLDISGVEDAAMGQEEMA